MEKTIKIPEGYEARIEGNKVILEPKESEDEKIRKEIIEFINWSESYGAMRADLHQQKCPEKWIAYLERQKEQRPIPKFKVGDRIYDKRDSYNRNVIREVGKDYYINAFAQKMDMAYTDASFEFLEHLDNDSIAIKPAEKISVSEELYEHIRNACACIEDAMSSDTMCDMTDYLEMANSSAQKAFDMLEKLKEQKPAEKPKSYDSMDDLLADALIDMVKESDLIDRDKKNRLVWIERHRTKPEGWSEEDEEMLRIVSNRLEKFNEWATEQGYPIDDPTMKQTPIAWLKSLRPQPHWKPSKEQMKALEEVRAIFHHHHLWDEINPILYNYEELMRDLQKLL